MELWCPIEFDLFQRSRFGIRGCLDWRSCGFNVQISVKIRLVLILLIVARAKFFPLCRFLVRYVFSVNGKFGKMNF